MLMTYFLVCGKPFRLEAQVKEADALTQSLSQESNLPWLQPRPGHARETAAGFQGPAQGPSEGQQPPFPSLGNPVWVPSLGDRHLGGLFILQG